MRLTLGDFGTAKGLFNDDVATCTYVVGYDGSKMGARRVRLTLGTEGDADSVGKDVDTF